MSDRPLASPAPNQGQAIGWLLVILAAFAVCTLPYLLYPVGGHPDERHYTIGAARMVESGDFLIPRTAEDEIRLKKPPLTYYYIAAGFQAFGETLAGAKALMVLSALGTLALTFGLARSIGASPTGAALAVGMVAGHGIFFNTATRHIPDMPLVLGTSLALLGAVHMLRPDRSAAWPWYAVFLGIAYAIIAKGMLALALLALILAVRLWPQRDRLPGPPQDRRHMVVAAVLGVVVAGAWFAAAWIAQPVEMTAQFLGDQVTGKVAFDPLIIPAGLARHTGFLILPLLPVLIALAFVWRQRTRSDGPRTPNRATLFLVLWCCATVVIFSFSDAVFSRYTLPALPAFAALVGLAIRAIPDQPLALALRRAGRAVLILPVVTGLIAALLAIRFDGAAIAGVTLLAVLIAAPALWFAANRARPWGAILVLALVQPLMDLARLPVAMSVGAPSTGQIAAAHSPQREGPRLVLDQMPLLDEIGLQTGNMALLIFAEAFDPDTHGQVPTIYFLSPDHSPAIAAAGYTITQYPVLRDVEIDGAGIVDALRHGDRDRLARDYGEVFHIATRD